MPKFQKRQADEPVGDGQVNDDAVAVAPEGDGAITLTLAQLKDLIRTSQTDTGLTADTLAKAFAQTQQRENTQAPMVSEFNPLGDTKHPKPDFVPRRVLQNGIELEPDTLLVEEIDLLNAIRPGEYRVTKSNGVRIPFTVQDTMGFDGTTIERREVHFPSRDEHRHDHRSLVDYCLEVLAINAQHDDIKRIESSRIELNRLRGR